MGTISKQAILDKTHYGLNIYSHILQSYYPGAIVLYLSGRTCAPARNPFNNDKPTLQVFIEKENVLGNSLDREKSCQREQNSNEFEVMPSAADFARSEFARHTDTENAIATGDAFSFAELHYKQSGEQLLQTLNKELNLRIGEQRGFYNHPICPKSPVEKVVSANIIENNQNQDNHKNQTNHSSDIEGCLFSFFKAPINNIKPHSETTLRKVYNAIVGNYYRDRTQKLRTISDVAQARKFKAANFDYCTFSGIFSSRNDKALIRHSNMLCIDFDHLNNVELLFNRLLQDDYFDTLLLFRSPSGDGLKWIIPIDVTQATHANYFLSVSNYLKATYGVEVDKSGRDISRACFLPHDPDAYIAPTFLNSLNSSKSL